MSIIAKEFPDGIRRCSWVPFQRSYYVRYHDEEWGRCVRDDRVHFEMLCLEGAQCGLSWNTILRRREEYRTAFHNFDVDHCAALSDAELGEIAAGKRGGIIRNRAKVNSVRHNAHVFKEIQAEFGSFDAYVWKFVENQTVVLGEREHPTVTAESRELAADLRERGMKFVGPTTMFAYLESAGMYNCHAPGCFAFEECGRQCEKADE